MGLVFLFSLQFGHAQSTGFSDSAIFTVEQQVVFQSDIIAQTNSLKRLQCAYKNSNLLFAVKLTRSLLNSVNQQFLPLDLVNKLILIEKMRREVSDQFDVDMQALWKEIAGRGCLQNGPNGWSDNLKSFFLLEVYLTQNFSKGTEQANRQNISKWLDKLDAKYKHHIYKFSEK